MSTLKPVEISQERADYIRRRCGGFRILIIGRANAGKTTILQRTCNTTDAPVIYDKDGEKIDSTVLDPSQRRGIHNIENEMIFESNPGFRFHDSCGFEAGRKDEFANVQDFINNRSKETSLVDQLHFIWYCIPLDSSRPYTEAENRFFSECNPGKVPVIVVFTKYDALEVKAYGALKQEGHTPDDAKLGAPNKAKENFTVIVQELSGKRHPPRGYVHLRDMHKEEGNCHELITRTAAALEDNETVLQMLVTTQRNNLELFMRYALEKTLIKKVQDGNSMKAGVISEHEKELTTREIMYWFPQYGLERMERLERLLRVRRERRLLEVERLRLGVGREVLEYYERCETNTDARTLLSGLDFESGSSTPAQVMIRLGITTTILADLAYILWDRRSQNPLSEAIDVYKGQGKHDVISRAVDESIVAFRQHGSKDQLGKEIVQIAFDNRISLSPDVDVPLKVELGPSSETAEPSKKLVPKKPNTVTRLIRRLFD